MGMITLEEKLFLDRWCSLDFSDWNESDIREEFIAPLLRVLGYSKGTVNNVIREKSLRLAQPFHRIGRKRVTIDYIPTVRLKNFWIIEAKPGNKREMDYGDLLQAHLYAIHPEIQSRFIVLINGWEIRVYDSLTVNSWEEPLFICSQKDCHDTFPELKSMLGAKEMLTYVRQRVLTLLKDSFEVELDESKLKSFTSEINRLANDMLPIVRKNAREFQLAAWKEWTEKEREELRNKDIKLLLVNMDIPTDARPMIAEIFVERVLSANKKERKHMVELLAMTMRGRPHSVFRVLAVYVFVRLLEEGIEIERSIYVKSVKETLEELVKSNRTYWSSNPLSNALCHLDNTTLRLAKKLSLRLAMDGLTKLVNEQKRTLPFEDLLVERPSVARHMVSLIGLLAELLWRKVCNATNHHDIWEAIWHYEFIEEIIEKMPLKPYPDGDSDLLFFEYYGRGYDMLCLGTWDVLHSKLDVLKTFCVDETVINFASLTRDEAIASIPLSIPRPDGWTPKEKYLIKIADIINGQ